MNSKAARVNRSAILEIASLLLLAGCSGGSSQSFNNQPPSNPSPSIATISPSNAGAGGAPFTLTINGANFVAASTVTFAGAAAPTTFVSSMQLTAAIPAAAIASAGTATVTVTNPASSGGTSNTVNFTITGPNPIPAVASLSPSCGPQGQPALNPFVNGQLLINGQGFVTSSVARWNGNDRPTTFYSSSQISAQISSSDIATAGTASVTVFNPAPGGGSSNTSPFTITAGGQSPQSIAVDPNGKFAYVANAGCEAIFGNVSMYTVDTNTGILASIAPPVVPPDEGTRFLAVDHSGNFAYVANWGEGDTAGSVSAYAIDATTGSLTPTGTTNGVCPGLCAPWSLVVDPSGKFAYVANQGGSVPINVSMYTINGTTGALTSIGTIAGGRSVSAAVDPASKFAYVATPSDPPGSIGNLSIYTINSATGALTSIGTIAAGRDPASVAVDPTGKFAYVTNSGSNDVSMYSINATTGALTSTGTAIAAGTSPVSVAVDPTGKFAYVANSGSNDVSMYIINTTMGTLTFTGTIAAGSSPTSIAIHPSGKFAYVTNSGSNNVSIYSIDATTGALTLIGTIGT